MSDVVRSDVVTSDVVKTERQGAVLEVILNRPDRLNAMNFDLIDGIYRGILQGKDPAIRAVLIRGEGRGFCAGGDIREFAKLLGSTQGASPMGVPPMGVPREMPDRLHQMIEQVRALPKPVIAVVHGPCAGAGLSLVLACDLAIVSAESKFNLAYVGIGLSPDGSSSYFLPRHVGMKRALEIFLTGKNMTAEEILELGLVNRVVPAGEVLGEGRQMAQMLAMGPTACYARVKQLVNASYQNSLHDQLALETDLICKSSETDDFRAGITAFLEKRIPEFKGR